MPAVRILIGMVMTGPQEEALEELQAAVEGTEVLDADFNVGRERKAQLLEQLRTQLMRGLPTAADRAALQSLRDLLESEAVEIKVFTCRPLHGKAYIFHRQDLSNPITALVGSSNLTAPGLTHNLELNVDVLETNGAQALAEWFEDRWNDKFSREVTADLLTMLDESWARKEPRRPYPGMSLARLYDPVAMSDDLIAAHSTLDRFVDQLFGRVDLSAEADRQKVLFRHYATRAGQEILV
ncbi:type IIL restriction-modification enzyme MmeI [Rhodococcus erythropolis]